jgi:cytochrome c-type biogenesis protein CcmH/NrfG
MRWARALLLAVAFAALLLPEVRRYGAERRLRSAEAALDFVLRRSAEVQNPVEVLDRVAERAAGAARPFPGDSRGLVLAGSAQLVAGNAQGAAGFYREALARGERAEIHLNLGRALDRLGRHDAARAAFLRAIWISPPLSRAVPEEYREPVRQEVERLEAELRGGRLAAPPPPPR